MQTCGSLIPAALLTVFAINPPDNESEGLALLTLCFGALGTEYFPERHPLTSCPPPPFFLPAMLSPLKAHGVVSLNSTT